MDVIVSTDRLLIHEWRAEDRAPFAALNGDPEVMQHFPSTLTRAESDAAVDALQDRFVRDGLCFWPVSERGGPFVGMVGLQVVDFDVPGLEGSVEIGWRLLRPYWGRGYATEAARGCLEHGFVAHGLDEIVAFTTHGNHASRRVMERLGMVRDPQGDFDHPRVAIGDPLRPHVLYRARSAQRG